jgi:hypothetical protein
MSLGPLQQRRPRRALPLLFLVQLSRFALDVELGGYAKKSPGALLWHGGVTAVRKLHKWNSSGTGIYYYGMVSAFQIGFSDACDISIYKTHLFAGFNVQTYTQRPGNRCSGVCRKS